MKSLNIYLISLILSFSSVLGAQAAIVGPSLQDLFNGGSIHSGNNLLDRWELNSFEYGGTNVVAPSLSQIFVDALNGGGLNPGDDGLIIDFGDQLLVQGDGQYNYVDISFSFWASVIDPAFQFVYDEHKYSGGPGFDPTSDNNVGISFFETVMDALGNQLGYKYHESSQLGILEGFWYDNYFTSGIYSTFSQEIKLTENIKVWATGEDENASLLSISQWFVQTPVSVIQPIPEPNIILLMITGLISFAVNIRYRKAHVAFKAYEK